MHEERQDTSLVSLRETRVNKGRHETKSHEAIYAFDSCSFDRFFIVVDDTDRPSLQYQSSLLRRSISRPWIEVGEERCWKAQIGRIEMCWNGKSEDDGRVSNWLHEDEHKSVTPCSFA